MHRYIVTLMVIAFSSSLSGYTQSEPADPSTLPLLPQARHIGTMFFGWGAPPPAPIQPRIDDATAVGMNAYTVYLDWPVLEPRTGEYDVSELRETLIWASENGLSTFANITVVDIEDLVLPPEYLSDTATFVGDYDFAHPELIERFLGLLDEVVPLMVDNGVFYLGVGNEVDGWIDQHPDELDAYLRFIAIARDHIHTLEPELAVGITVTGGVPLEDPLLLDAFYDVSDVVSANIYGIDVSDFTLTNRAETIDLLERFIAGFDGKPVVIPEIGCNSAESMKSSLQLQRACFETIFDILQAHPTVRFATVFTFHDFEDSLCQLIQEAFGLDTAAIDNIYDQRVADYLCTLGVVNADGSPKPAFESFLTGVASLTTP